jgi:hypothetical protein
MGERVVLYDMNCRMQDLESKLIRTQCHTAKRRNGMIFTSVEHSAPTYRSGPARVRGIRVQPLAVQFCDSTLCGSTNVLDFSFHFTFRCKCLSD